LVKALDKYKKLPQARKVLLRRNTYKEVIANEKGSIFKGSAMTKPTAFQQKCFVIKLWGFTIQNFHSF